jgi:EAL domain-containing protein (putative c-di-GMP-specific phosphodiesterase class I)
MALQDRRESDDKQVALGAATACDRRAGEAERAGVARMWLRLEDSSRMANLTWKWDETRVKKYAQCSKCLRKGLYVVPGRDVVRCRYCRALWSSEVDGAEDPDGAGHEERSLRKAIERDELRLLYQPAMVLPEGTILGVEALVRWQHPREGLLLPHRFLPVAEDTGLIVPLGAWVLTAACQQARRWKDAMPDHPLFVSVNVSTRQLGPEFPSLVAEAVKTAGIEPHLLWLEITKSGLVDDFSTLEPCLAELKALGVKLALDDFGTGYSSLADLQHLPVDILKVDRGLVQDVGGNSRATRILASILDMAHALDLTVITAGVETEAQLAELTRLGCDLAQGLYWAPPLPAEQVTSMVDAGRHLTRSTRLLMPA